MMIDVYIIMGIILGAIFPKPACFCAGIYCFYRFACTDPPPIHPKK